LLSPEIYKYDIEKNEPKPLFVEANESKLANKLFDPCEVTGGDNGRTLYKQYKTAIDMLTPKLNINVSEMKNKLRDMLMTPYPYDFGDKNGLQTDLTLHEVYYRLYDEWVKTKQEWLKIQSKKKNDLSKQYPNLKDPKSNREFQNAYLEWYQNEAEAFEEALNEQMGKIVSVFSPNDMQVIEGILSSGSGAELEEAREVLNNIRKSNPDGSYTYPVSLYPQNWFELLDNSFSGTDLLESPEILEAELERLNKTRIMILSTIRRMTPSIPSDAKIDEAEAKVKSFKDQLDQAGENLGRSYGEGMKTFIDTALKLYSGGLNPLIIGNILIKKSVPIQNGSNDVAAADLRTTSVSEEPGAKSLLDDITDQINNGLENQRKYIDAAKELVMAQRNAIELKNLSSLKANIAALEADLVSVDAEISTVKDKYLIVSALKSVPDGDRADDESVEPKKVPKGFTPIVIDISSKSLETNSTKETSASQSSFGINLLFGGYSQSNSSASSAFSDFTSEQNTIIKIGMSVAKVSIERNWFNPGIFLLTGDWCNLTQVRISIDETKLNNPKNKKEKFDTMKNCVLPCFPVAFVVARDVTIKLCMSSNTASSFARTAESHSSKGGGFLFMRGNSSSSSSSSQNSTNVSASSTGVTIRFTDPQILGYYLEQTPADLSESVFDKNGDLLAFTGKAANFQTILQYANSAKTLLLEHIEEIKRAKLI
jgi:hypothetical protein